MKTTKRFIAMAAALTLTACAAMPMASFAEDPPATGVITITDSTGATHNTLSAFKIFNADVDANKNLVITGWGAGIDITKLNAAIAADSTLSSLVTLEDSVAGAQAAADKIAALDTQSKKEALARAIAKSVKGEGKAAKAASGNTTIEGLDNGYYVVIDTSAATKDNYTAFTLGLLAVVNGETVTVSPKMDFPSLDKQIGDINDTTETAGNFTYNEAGDWDIGDDVPFKLIATIPSNIDKYDTYKMIFHDNLQDSVFSLNGNSVVVKYYANNTDTTGKDVTANFTKTTPDTENTKFGDKIADKTENLNLACADIKNISEITVTSAGRFEVTYTAKLTENAVIGQDGNWNGAYLEYSNNPNYSGSGDTNNTGDSPEDTVVAFTYQAVVNKVDGVTNAPLEGAEFTLTKTMKDGSTKTVAVVNTDDGTRFVFNGLDDGTYTLHESNPPSGYTAAADVTFTITGTEVQTDGSEALGDISVNGDVFTKCAVYNISSGKATKGDKTGAVEATIKNYKGTNLPATGGIGTTLFILGGGCAAGIAGIYLVSKKKTREEE